MFQKVLCCPTIKFKWLKGTTGQIVKIKALHSFTHQQRLYFSIYQPDGTILTMFALLVLALRITLLLLMVFRLARLLLLFPLFTPLFTFKPVFPFAGDNSGPETKLITKIILVVMKKLGLQHFRTSRTPALPNK